MFVACFEFVSSLVVIYKKNHRKISICNTISREDTTCRFKTMQLPIYSYAAPLKVKKSINLI